jgi:ABC-2 type transport system ATP-binding protein
LIKKIGKEKTVLLSSHILAEVEATCDRILIISKGKIVADGTADELRQKAHGKEILKVRIEDAETNTVFKALQSLPTVESVDFVKNEENTFEIQSKHQESSRRAVSNLCVSKGWTLTGMTSVETKLEDIFRELTLN